MAQGRDNDTLTERRPMAEPGPTRGADVGGMAANADGGLRDALQRSSERGDDDAIGGATIGQGGSGGREPRLDLGGTAEPGSASGAAAPSRRGPSEEAPVDDRPERSSDEADTRRERSDAGRTDTVPPDGDAGTTRHDPDEPPDESAIESLGRSVSEVVTGPLEDDENRDAGSRSR